MIEDILTRGWEHFVARTTGPMNFRFIVQPAVAIFFAIRAGLKDSQEGRPAFFWAVLAKAGSRQPFLREGLTDTKKVFILAMILDATYQIFIQRQVYVLELFFTAAVLAFVPYLLIRGPTNRIATWIRSHQGREQGVGSGSRGGWWRLK